MSLITVVVPVYKVEKYLDRCVKSILEQSFPDFDLVLVDDGSPDSCPQICDGYAEKDSRITVIHKQNGGLSDARNAGIDWAMEHSDSQWLAFVDSDDFIHPDYLKTLYETAEKEEADLVICDFERVNDQEEGIEKKHSFFDLVTEEKERLFGCLVFNWRIVPAWNKLYHKHIFSQLRFAVGKIHEDSFAISHVLWNSQRVSIIPDVLYYYRIRKNSIMTTETPKSRLDGLEAVIEQYEFFQKHNILPRKSIPLFSLINEFTDLKSGFTSLEKQRFIRLKKRLSKLYFNRKENQSIKHYFSYFFPGMYGRIAAFRKESSTKS